MKTTTFDATLDLSDEDLRSETEGRLTIGTEHMAVAVSPYRGPEGSGTVLARIASNKPVDIKWMDRFDFLSADGRISARGTVLYPCPADRKKLKPERMGELLGRMSTGDKEMLLALTEEKGISGLRSDEISEFSRLGQARVESLAKTLEEEDKIRILSFSPLFLVSRRALDFLRAKVSDYLALFHRKHPGRRGVGIEKIAERFGPPERILSLVIHSLAKEGLLCREAGLVWLADFRIALTPEEEKILGRIEKLLDGDQFAPASLKEIRRRLRLSEVRLQTLLSVLTERKKIVKGRDGFILHSRWLDGIVKSIKESGKRELTVAEFKSMTGLSRKYAIPLLELLDEMGVTRRKGSVRTIL